MSIKQFIAGFALEKASQIKESKKDILDTINTRLSTHLTGLQDRNKQFINMSSEAYGRLEQLKSYAKIYNLNEAELAVAAMDQDLTNRIIKNATRPYVAEKIKELGGLFKSSGKTPGMTADQYIDIFTKKKLKTIYPNQNLIFSDVETMAGLGTRGFTQRKIERAKAQADYAKSLYAFNQTTPSDVTMKDFTLRPEVFTDPSKALSETKSGLINEISDIEIKLKKSDIDDTTRDNLNNQLVDKKLRYTTILNVESMKDRVKGNTLKPTDVSRLVSSINQTIARLPNFADGYSITNTGQIVFSKKYRQQALREFNIRMKRVVESIDPDSVKSNTITAFAANGVYIKHKDNVPILDENGQLQFRFTSPYTKSDTPPPPPPSGTGPGTSGSGPGTSNTSAKTTINIAPAKVAPVVNVLAGDQNYSPMVARARELIIANKDITDSQILNYFKSGKFNNTIYNFSVLDDESNFLKEARRR